MKTVKKGKTADIKLENDLSEKYSASFINNMKELIQTGFKRFNIDFTNVKYIDSAALSKLIVYCDKSDLEFMFRNIRPPIKNIFNIIRLDKRVVFE